MFRFDDSAYIKLGQIGFGMDAAAETSPTLSGGAVKYYANSAA